MAAMLRVVARLLVCLAFAAAFAAPAVAHAALLPACENLEFSGLLTAPEAAEAPQSPANGGADDCSAEDQAADSKVAAMCDARGASAVAPGRIFPIGDARIDAVPNCNTEDGSGATVAPGESNDSPAASAAIALPEHAILVPVTVWPAFASELAPEYPAPSGGPAAGVRFAVDHPPRF